MAAFPATHVLPKTKVQRCVAASSGMNNGVLHSDDKTGRLMPHHPIWPTDYKLITTLIFNNPAGSLEQNSHEDIAGCDRDPYLEYNIYSQTHTMCENGGNEISMEKRK